MQSKVFVENSAETASWLGCFDKGVVYFIKLLFESAEKKFEFSKVEG